ncbi:hypothetical protein [Aquabacter spiritensis]|uniref:Uncharacterized protein n=1 Tax=Aquabacter spiritensis TaxID=933073 RepID=A0A4R3LWU4_9HYPH|nr:hypothetical protein [Aquabacter spiritensis]TCT04249.1 hypothetical protein EDC64_10765 [Aquabacter spiritensis]
MAEDGTQSPGSTAPERLYADGHPLDDVHYIESKIILSGLRFTSVQSFFEFAKIVARVAKRCEVDFEPHTAKGVRPQIREVLFLDTQDFLLYNHSFILRRRIMYEDGFPVGNPEIVFKFRHPDRDTAAALDVRPQIPGDYRIKFKEEALPLKDRLGGVRALFSHNVEFEYHPRGVMDPTAASTLIHVFPALGPVLSGTRKHVQLVNRTAVEEVLQQLGMLDFGKGLIAPCNVSVWRTRGDQNQLVGEFSYQVRFLKREDLNAKALQRADTFFRALQEEAKDWISLGTTKTGAVYRLKGNPPQSHE